MVTPFVAGFVARVCSAVVESLKGPPPTHRVIFGLEAEKVSLEVDGTPVPLDSRQGFAETIVRDTLRGMLSHLKGIDPGGAMRIEVHLQESDGPH